MVHRTEFASDHIRLNAETLFSILASVEATHRRFDDETPHLAVIVQPQIFDATNVVVSVTELTDVVAALIDRRVPDDCIAFGVVCTGHARAVTEMNGSFIPNLDAVPEPIRIGLLIDRFGVVVTGIRTARNPFERVTDTGFPPGRIPDACQRVLGLATPHPHDQPYEMWSACWLEAIFAHAVRSPGQLTWPGVVGLHPAITEFGIDARIHFDYLADQVLAKIRSLTNIVSWRDIRSWVALGHLRNLEITPQAARWMDDGMFSREVMGRYATNESVMTELEPLIAPRILHALESAIGY